jgi:REP-associated tyrosine transposase
MGVGGYKIRNQENIHSITCAVVGWVDVFTRTRYRDILVNSFQFYQEHKGLLVYSWVIMSNHVHLIVAAKKGSRFSDILRDFKKHTAVEIVFLEQTNP